MYTRWSAVLLLVAFLCVVSFGPVVAAPAASNLAAAGIEQAITDHSAARYAGEITSKGSQGFTIETQSGEISIVVSTETRYRSIQGDISFEFLEISQTIGVYGIKQPDGSLLAKKIVLIPADFDLQHFHARSVRGEVWSIDLDASSFELRVRGAVLVFKITEATIFNSPKGSVQSLEDLQVHQRVRVIGKQSDAGDLTAMRIIASRGPYTRHLGVIASLDPGEYTLTLNRQDGRTVTFVLSEAVRIKSENPEVDKFADLSAGMRVTVVSRKFEDDRLQAILIYVPAEDTP